MQGCYGKVRNKVFTYDYDSTHYECHECPIKMGLKVWNMTYYVDFHHFYSLGQMKDFNNLCYEEQDIYAIHMAKKITKILAQAQNHKEFFNRQRGR